MGFADLHELVELDRSILVQIDFFDHVAKFVGRRILAQRLHDITQLRDCNVTILISVELKDRILVLSSPRATVQVTTYFIELYSDLSKLSVTQATHLLPQTPERILSSSKPGGK